LVHVQLALAGIPNADGDVEVSVVVVVAGR